MFYCPACKSQEIYAVAGDISVRYISVRLAGTAGRSYLRSMMRTSLNLQKKTKRNTNNHTVVKTHYA